MKSEERFGKLFGKVISALNTLYYATLHIKRYMKDLRNLPYMVNNFLMRYPDSFSQRIKKLRTDRIYIIFKAQVNQIRRSGDIYMYLKVLPHLGIS